MSYRVGMTAVIYAWHTRDGARHYSAALCDVPGFAQSLMPLTVRVTSTNGHKILAWEPA